MGSVSAEISTTAKKWRNHPPSPYSLKVDNFKQLEKFASSSDDKYQSRLFSSGGYNWYVSSIQLVLILMKLNKTDNGKGFISMYVEIDSKSLISAPQREVFAELIFFVYNKKENKYFTVQGKLLVIYICLFTYISVISIFYVSDVEVKRFNALQTVWGLRQVLPFDSFNNPENGYVFEGDQCEFGVDVVVPSPVTNWEILSFNEKFSWNVKNFSQLKENRYTSNTFSMGARQWVLWLYPKGDSRTDGKWLSLFLLLADCDKPKADEKIFVQAYLRVLDPHGSNHKAYRKHEPLARRRKPWFWLGEVLSLADLRKLYLDKEDALNVEVEFNVLIPTTDHPALNVSLTSCERIHVSGYPRTKLGKYAHSFRIKLAPLVLSREATQKKSGLCSPVAIPVLVGIIITGAAFGFWTVGKFVVSEDEGVDVSVDQFVKWATRSVAATFLFQHNGYSFADGSFHFS
ncbi:unnamed protein product [Brassica napus]|uniref:(rape) hypothetical protein n=2 Tax=Brassica napus TaxID=3708 RepID=A0A816K9W7_BRANA|nr:unnamed protein product [Brassica napus]